MTDQSHKLIRINYVLYKYPELSIEKMHYTVSDNTGLTWLTVYSKFPGIPSAERKLSQQVLCWHGNTVKCLHCWHVHHVTSGAIGGDWLRMIDMLWWASGVDDVGLIQSKLRLSFIHWRRVHHARLRQLNRAVWARCIQYTHVVQFVAAPTIQSQQPRNHTAVSSETITITAYCHDILSY